jgi:hypothetical protein
MFRASSDATRNSSSEWARLSIQLRALYADLWIAPPVNNGIPADVAMPALLEGEEEMWRRELLDPDITEEERARITETLR